MSSEKQKRKEKKNMKEKADKKGEKEDPSVALTRTVFVGNLPLGIAARKVQRLFAAIGKVQSVRLRSVPLAEVRNQEGVEGGWGGGEGGGG